MCIEKYVESIVFDGPPPVEDLNFAGIIVFGYDHFGSEFISPVGGDEGISVFNFVPRGCYSVGIVSAAFLAWAICGDPHSYDCSLFWSGLCRIAFGL